MKGDYCRYTAEICKDEERKDAAEEALVAYKTSLDIGRADLPVTHPIRLGLALNFSVFYYEILGAPDLACKIAREAFDDALKDLDKLPEENYKDSTLIMQLLRDNLSLWTAEHGEGEEDGEQQEDVQDLEQED